VSKGTVSAELEEAIRNTWRAIGRGHIMRSESVEREAERRAFGLYAVASKG
jgi:hypothetical protein